MRSFFTSFFASLLAFLVFCVIIFFVIMGIVSAFGRQFEEKTANVKPNSVLRINTNYAIAEQTQKGLPEGLGLLGYDPEHALGLNDILANIRHAEKDDNIKGIYLELGICPNSYATLQEIRQALQDFKTASGKFVIAYGEVISQNSYYLGSVADKVYLNPSGAVDFKGLSAQIAFYKGTLDKLGVKTEVFYDGKFKSATEPFRFDKMSDENRLQLREFLNALFNENLSEISETRKMDVSAYRNIADSLKAWYPQYAVETGLMDGLRYYDEVIDEMKEKCGLGADRELHLMNMRDYRKTFTDVANTADRIALVYADGTIIDGEGSNGYLGSRTFAKMMQEVREDDHIKAVVLRVNSPGGSAVASDVMWREIEVTKKVKPVVVSMGDYAASGGYMISCNANKIFAEPNTLTGSIGVFMIIPEISDFMEDKIGITYDTAKTSAFSDFPSITHPFSPYEKKILQQGVDSTYVHFKQMVAQGRGLTVDQVEEIAQGRIWIGEKAKELGLVDEIGGIDEAIAAAKELAHLDDYNIKEFPEQKESVLENVFSSLTEETKAQMQASQLGILYPHYKAVQELLQHPSMQARMPYDIVIR